MDLGAFSISLPVSDIRASHAFYTSLGFTHLGGDLDQNWVVLRNGTTVIGLFQGMIDQPTLTFNPGWDAEAHEVDPFTDVREIQRRMLEAGIVLDVAVEDGTTGPGYLTLRDPDGFPLLIDQHR